MAKRFVHSLCELSLVTFLLLSSIAAVAQAPQLSSISPTSGTPGVTQVTFTGTGFGATQGSGQVWLGSTYGVVSNCITPDPILLNPGFLPPSPPDT